MGIEHFEPTEEQKAYLVKAIENDDRLMVASLLKRFGREVWLTHRRVEPRQFLNVVHELSGTPIHIAAYLKKDELAVSLLEAGAEIKLGYFNFEASHNDQAGSVTVIEHAVSNRLPALTKALMRRKPGVDWNHKNLISLTADEFKDETLFDKLRHFEDDLAFLSKVGGFAGRVGEKNVVVETHSDTGFIITVNDFHAGYAATMGEALNLVALAVGLEQVEPFPAPKVLTVEEERAALAILDADIPY